MSASASSRRPRVRPPWKIGHVDGAGDREGRAGIGRRQADRAVIGVDAYRWQRVADDRSPRRFGGAHALERRLVIGPRLVAERRRRRRSTCLASAVRQRRIELESLAERQADHARQLQLRLLEVVDGHRRPLRLRAQLDFGAQHVDAGDEAVLLQVERLLVAASAPFPAERVPASARADAASACTNRLPAT